MPSMDKEFIERYDKAVPRYTSYPTAPHFSPAIGPAAYERWLREIDPAARLSLYIHIPFCARLCSFCGCHTRITRRYQPIAAYLEALSAELGLVARAIGRRQTVTAIHWGGGSPTMLSAADFSRLTKAMGSHFGLADDAGMAVEIDPRTLKAGFVAAMAEAGVRRASLGVQDFDAKVQRAINRVQPFEVVRDAVKLLRGAGIGAINFDLMYGLPYQTVESIRRNVDLALALRPDRIALFGYAHVPWMKRHQRLIPEAALPSGVARFEMAQVAAERLSGAGYRRIGLDHFARPDDSLCRAYDERRLRRNFQGYTTDNADVLLGFGASAIGTLPAAYVQNAVAIHQYQRAVESGSLATVKGVALDAGDRARRSLIERLMCGYGVDLDREPGLNGDMEPILSALAPMADDGLIDVDGGRLDITDKGRPFMRNVCAAFDSYFEARPQQHSRAI